MANQIANDVFNQLVKQYGYQGQPIGGAIGTSPNITSYDSIKADQERQKQTATTAIPTGSAAIPSGSSVPQVAPGSGYIQSGAQRFSLPQSPPSTTSALGYRPGVNSEQTRQQNQALDLRNQQNSALRDTALKDYSDSSSMLNMGAYIPTEYDRAFVGGKADMSNPSYRNAMGAIGVLNDKREALRGRQTAAATALGIEQGDVNTQRTLEGQQYSSDAGVRSHAIQLEGTKYNADATVKAHQITGDSTVKAQQVSALGEIGKANIMSTAKAAEAKNEAAKDQQKEYKDRVNSHYKAWQDLNIPPEYRQNLQKYAALQADAEDPQGSTFILAPPRPGMEGLAVPRQYKTVYDELRKTMPHKDAAARIAGMARKAGTAHPMPNLYQYKPLKDSYSAIP